MKTQIGGKHFNVGTGLDYAYRATFAIDHERVIWTSEVEHADELIATPGSEIVFPRPPPNALAEDRVRRAVCQAINELPDPRF